MCEEIRAVCGDFSIWLMNGATNSPGLLRLRE